MILSRENESQILREREGSWRFILSWRSIINQMKMQMIWGGVSLQVSLLSLVWSLEGQTIWIWAAWKRCLLPPPHLFQRIWIGILCSRSEWGLWGWRLGFLGLSMRPRAVLKLSPSLRRLIFTIISIPNFLFLLQNRKAWAESSHTFSHHNGAVYVCIRWWQPQPFTSVLRALLFER